MYSRRMRAARTEGCNLTVDSLDAWVCGLGKNKLMYFLLAFQQPAFLLEKRSASLVGPMLHPVNRKVSEMGTERNRVLASDSNRMGDIESR